MWRIQLAKHVLRFRNSRWPRCQTVAALALGALLPTLLPASCDCRTSETPCSIAWYCHAWRARLASSGQSPREAIASPQTVGNRSSSSLPTHPHRGSQDFDVVIARPVRALSVCTAHGVTPSQGTAPTWAEPRHTRAVVAVTAAAAASTSLERRVALCRLTL